MADPFTTRIFDQESYLGRKPLTFLYRGITLLSDELLMTGRQIWQ